MIVEKDIFYPGTFTTPDGRRHTFTDADVRNAYTMGVAQLRNQLAVPGVWEHDARAEPIPMSAFLSAFGDYDDFRDWSAKWAKNAYGHVVGYGLKQANGRPVLHAKFDLADPADAGRLEKAKFVSCRVDKNYQSPDGRIWPGWSVCHVAATPRPVQLGQEAWRTASLSGLSRLPRETVYLSTEGVKMADGKDDKPDGAPNATDAGAMSRALSALATLGFPMPESVTDVNTMALALEVLAAAKGGGGDMDGDGEGDGYSNPDLDGTEPAGGAPIMLSDLSVPQQNAYRIQEAGARAARVNAVTAVTRTLTQTGQMTAARAAALLKEAQTVSLSMMPNGRFTSTLDPRIADLREVAGAHKGKRQKGRQTALLSQTIGVGIPEIPTPGKPTPAEKAANIARAVKEAEDRVSNAPKS